MTDVSEASLLTLDASDAAAAGDCAPCAGPDRAAPVPQEPWIRIYPVRGYPLPRIVPSPPMRSWYSEAEPHCLPLTMGSQLGWTVLNPAPFTAAWAGGATPPSLKIEVGTSQPHVLSHFGHGILSIAPGFHVQTSPEVGLLVKGVPNYEKDGVQMLEALIETDWYEGPFTMNLLLTRPGLKVAWEEGEPLFQLVPYPRGWIERFRPEVVTDGAEYDAFMSVVQDWGERRKVVLRRLREDPNAPRDGRYLRGLRTDESKAPPSHQRRLRVPPFPGLGQRPREL
jgi:hypothetical protein